MDGQSDILLETFSLAPEARFRYSFSARTRLNLTYNGAERQPFGFQLRQIPEISINGLIIYIGNSELTPEFTHRINATFNHFSQRMHTLNSSVSYSITQNQIGTTTIDNPSLFPNIQLDSSILRPGMRIFMPENTGVGHTGNVQTSYGMPFFSERLYVSASMRGQVRNWKGSVDKDLNVVNRMSMKQNLRITYRQERFDVGMEGELDLIMMRASLQPERKNRMYENFVRANLNLHIIPRKLTLSSDVQYLLRTGLHDYNHISTIWNAQLSYNIGTNNNAQLLFQVVDILNDRKETRHVVTDASIIDTQFNTLRRFFMVSFIYSKRRQ
jgi:hypothetical protein